MSPPAAPHHQVCRASVALWTTCAASPPCAAPGPWLSDLTPEPIAVQSSPFGLADNDEEDPADFLSDLERLKLERASEFVVST